MVEIFTTEDNLHIFLSLTGHAFDATVPDARPYPWILLGYALVGTSGVGRTLV